MQVERYQILIRGLIGESWASYFTGMTLMTEPAGITRLCGEIADQSALHGIMNKIRDLNLKIISIQLLDNDGVTPVACRDCLKNKPSITSFG